MADGEQAKPEESGKVEKAEAAPVKLITVTVKTPKEKEGIDVDENATVKDVSTCSNINYAALT